MIGRKIQQRQTPREFLTPVVPESVSIGAIEEIRFPTHIVVVLDGCDRQARSRPLCVDGLQVGHHDDQRPEITHDVMRHNEEDVVVLCAGENSTSKQRARLEIERSVRFM